MTQKQNECVLKVKKKKKIRRKPGCYFSRPEMHAGIIIEERLSLRALFNFLQSGRVFKKLVM